MKKIYNETMGKIKANDKTKAETVARMQEKLAAKKSSAPSSRKRLYLTVTSAVCVICLCISIPLIVHYVNIGSATPPGALTPPNIGIYQLGQTYTREDGASVTFSDIRIDNNLSFNDKAYRGTYLIITGHFDFAQFTFYTNESITSIFNEDIGEDTVLRLDRDLTMQLSEADLHIDDPAGGETRGEISLVYRINAITLEYITAHNNDTHTDDELRGDITLNLSGCYTDKDEPIQFIFFCEDVTLFSK